MIGKTAKEQKCINVYDRSILSVVEGGLLHLKSIIIWYQFKVIPLGKICALRMSDQSLALQERTCGLVLAL